MLPCDHLNFLLSKFTLKFSSKIVLATRRKVSLLNISYLHVILWSKKSLKSHRNPRRITYYKIFESNVCFFVKQEGFPPTGYMGNSKYFYLAFQNSLNCFCFKLFLLHNQILAWVRRSLYTTFCEDQDQLICVKLTMKRRLKES
jgi:hypothetical protein